MVFIMIKMYPSLHKIFAFIFLSLLKASSYFLFSVKIKVDKKYTASWHPHLKFHLGNSEFEFDKTKKSKLMPLSSLKYLRFRFAVWIKASAAIV